MGRFEELYEKILSEADSINSDNVNDIFNKAKQKFNDLNSENAQAWIKAQIIKQELSNRTEKLKSKYPNLYDMLKTRYPKTTTAAYTIGSTLNPSKIRNRMNRASSWLREI